MSKYLITRSKEYIFIILIVTVVLLTTFSKSFAEDEVFIIGNVKVEGTIDVNFSRDKYINKAFLNSFKILMSKILVSKDLTLGQFIYIIRKRIELNPEQALFIMINHSLAPNNKTISELYDTHKDKDNFLYITYTSENTFG